MTTPEGLVWINGTVTPYGEGRIALEDRGFVFGDGVYEVIRAYDATPFALQAHLERLRRSAGGIEIDLPQSDAELRGIIGDLLRQTGSKDAEIYMQLTRGVARRNHPFPEGVPPTLVIGVRDLRPLPDDLWDQGVTAITVDDERWVRCDLKTIGLLPNVLAKQKAQRKGAFEAFFIRQGFLTEGSSTNVGLVRDGKVITPIADNRILPGVTRAEVLRLAAAAGVTVEERDVSVEELARAHEVFLMSTRLEVMPVVMVDARPVGDGCPGPVTSKLRAAIQAETRKVEGL